MALRGDLGTVDLPALLQLNEQGKGVRVSLRRGDQKGEIFLKGKQVLHASLGEVKGESALQELLAWREGKFTMDEGSPPEVSIGKDLTHLLLLSASILDENGPAHCGSAASSASEDAIITKLREIRSAAGVKEAGAYFRGRMVGNGMRVAEEIMHLLDALEDLPPGSTTYLKMPGHDLFVAKKEKEEVLFMVYRGGGPE